MQAFTRAGVSHGFLLRDKRQALRCVHMHGFITSKQYHTLTDIPELIAAQELEALRKQGALRAIDQSSGRRYRL
jgi:hypothetical protein